MKKEQFDYHHISRVFDPSYEQVSLGKFYEDPLNLYLLSEGTLVKIYGKNGRVTDAFAKSKDNGLSLSCRLPTQNFEFGSKILMMVDVGPKTYAIQVVVKSAHMGNVYVEDTSTRYFERFPTMFRATALALPAHFASNVTAAKWSIERRTFESESGRTFLRDMIIDEKTSVPIRDFALEKQSNILITSLSQGGFGIKRSLTPDSKPLRYLVVNFGYYQKGKFIQNELLGIVRNSTSKDWVEHLNCCFVSPVDKISGDLYPHETKLNLALSDTVEVYVNGDIKGHSQNIDLYMAPGRHSIKLVTKTGQIFEEIINLNTYSSKPNYKEIYELFAKFPISCTATAEESTENVVSGI